MVSDRNVTISQLKERVNKFVEERKWKKYHKPKDLAISIIVEASELLEHFQWLGNNEVDKLLRNSEKLRQIGAELADIIIYCLSLSNVLGTDISQTVLRKVRENEEKYPVEETRGSYKKYSEIRGR